MSQQTLIKELPGQGLGPSARAARLGVDRNTVRQYLAHEDCSPTPPARRIPGPSKLDPDIPVRPQWLAEDARIFHKQHHTAQRVLERLRAEYPDFVGSYALVQRYVKSLWTPTPATGTLPTALRASGPKESGSGIRGSVRGTSAPPTR
jgi:transposase